MKVVIFNPYEEFNLNEEVRLAVNNQFTKDFVHLEIIPPKRTIEYTIPTDINIDCLRYKYQVKCENKRWVDTKYGYRYFTNNGSKRKYSRKSLLKILHFTSSVKPEISKLLEANEQDLGYCFRYILNDSYQLLRTLSETNIELLETYIHGLPEKLLLKSNVTAFYHSTMHVLLYFLKKKILINKNNLDMSTVTNMIEESYNFYEYKDNDNLGFKAGFLLAKGNIYSIHSRSKAYNVYQEILSLESSTVEAFLGLEALTTYFKGVESKNNTYSIYESEFNECVDKSINLCFSADSSYFKMYALNWLQASLYFEELTFNYGLVVESEDKFKELVDHYYMLLNKFSDMVGITIKTNTRFFWIKSNIVNKTVYACARFYLSSYLLKKYEGAVYITDIDQFINGNLSEYLQRVLKNDNFDIYLPKMSGVYKYLPGRSHLAGNIFIKNTLEGRAYSDLLTDYVGLGLEEPFSWMLDQNATRFASEKYNVGNLQDFGKRALEQFADLKRIMRDQVNNI